MTQNNYSNNNDSSKLLLGVVVGAAVGAAIALLDNSTRQKVISGSKNLGSSTGGFVRNVKENPGEFKNDVTERFKSAVSTLKSAMNEAQTLYEKVNEEVVPQIESIRESASEIVETAKEVTEDAKDIGSQVADAGSEVKGSVSTGDQHDSNVVQLSKESQKTVDASPKGDIPGDVGRQ
ncbi:YtxH domain-containing protein [Jeotgalibacillus sp. R-1-5s-1]|uniref:YtxH domain-containing protein n=1 Tax=Jeotgalibacillus sp. R-1-5s-1 TaxID=2555897 RepID=UPI00106C34DE|nr:YtxH domain-containing protein [Jeotgalibacillus sp. R-1-5s-1]TFE01843.1 YtxH domain-containing protein [Jeotgalibacillus sp. R-1-5s-1]